MMSPHRYVALDLGAESGRVILGTLTERKLEIREIHRFATLPVTASGTLRWDIPRIFDELKIGLHRVAVDGNQIASISTDSWGFDYVHFSENNQMLSLPFHYRDSRTDGGLEKAFATVPADLVFSETGTQFSQFNTLYQLLDDMQHQPSVMQSSEHFLNIGDYFNFLFSGVCRSEASLASTSQLYNPRLSAWSEKLIRGFNIPRRIFSQIVASGTKLGDLLPSYAEAGLSGAYVVASCSHDTAAAVAAVPAEGRDWAYLSSGTWSLLGVELQKPIINSQSQKYNFTNEVGYGGTIRFLKNLVGLWIVQECRREWARSGQEFSYDELAQEAEKATGLRSLVNPDDPRFAKPHGMPQKIVDYCRETRQAIPGTAGEIIRCALDSLALLYRKTLNEIQLLTGCRLTSLHIVGGGSENRLLNQLTANATQKVVLAGPSQATAVGNILVQAIAMGQLNSLEDLRFVVRNSFPVTEFQPQNTSVWNDAYDRFQKLP